MGSGRTLVIVYDVAQVVSAAVVGLAHRHGVVCEVDIAVVACLWLKLLDGEREGSHEGARRRGCFGCSWWMDLDLQKTVEMC